MLTEGSVTKYVNMQTNESLKLYHLLERTPLLCVCACMHVYKRMDLCVGVHVFKPEFKLRGT